MKPMYIVFCEDGEPWAVYEKKRDAEAMKESDWKVVKYVPAK